jgi:molybdopterin molybdotransferase
MVRWLAVGLDEALRLTLEHIQPLGPGQHVELVDAVDRIAAEDLYATVDSPSVDASLKDGYAVISAEVAVAKESHPVTLRLAGCMAAGGSEDIPVAPGTAVRVLTGARIPRGADAVVSEEFVENWNDRIEVRTFAEPGRNILPRGIDVAAGKCIARKGRRLTPGLAGLLAASGHSTVAVVPNPKVAIVATGDEVVAPGQPLPDGKLYASNMTTLAAWCRRYGMRTHTELVRDEPDEIFQSLQSLSEKTDAVITSGGAWTGDRDMVAQILEKLGWKQVFHRIRIGPGKAVGFGLLRGKPIFILPGGPPSNLMGFLQIAFPGLLKLAGHESPALPRAMVRLATDLTGRYIDWTQFVFGDLEMGKDLPLFHPLLNSSRLGSMADAKAVVPIAEGQTLLTAGSIVSAQLLE